MERSQRMTRQRRIILEELEKMEIHPTADQLYEVVRKRIDRISLGTVYRNLELLSRSGRIKRIDTAGGKIRFDGHPGEHTHIKCEKCGKIDDLPVPGKCGSFCQEDVESSGYLLTGTKIEFRGLCPSCRESSRKEA